MGAKPVILVHGECGSGKSAALRALESTPPTGFRAVYVPVPTLDFSGIARWSLARLGTAHAADPTATLREAIQRMRLLLLIDDVEVLPRDTALALQRFERESGGALGIVVACVSDRRECAALAALGPPSHTIEVGRAGGGQAVAALRECIAPAPSPARAPAPAAHSAPRAAPPPAAAAAGPAAPPQAKSPPPHVGPAKAPASAAARTAPAVAAREPERPTFVPRPAESVRTVPLSRAIAMAVTAFLIPLAFVAGYLVGSERRANHPPASLAGEAPTLPPVSSAPPTRPAGASDRGESRVAAEIALPPLAPETAPLHVEAEAEPLPRRVAAAAAAPPARETARDATPLQRAPGKARAAAPTKRRPAKVVAESGDRAEWGAPALISVEPGSVGP